MRTSWISPPRPTPRAFTACSSPSTRARRSRSTARRACCSRRSSSARAGCAPGALTFCLPWHDPYRLYHEVCMLDQLSGGRLELGVGRGVSPIESKIFGMTSIEESRERYREALDGVLRSLRQPGAGLRRKDIPLPRHGTACQAAAEALPAAVVSQQQPRVDRVHRAPRLPHRVSRQARRLQGPFRSLPRLWGLHRDDPGPAQRARERAVPRQDPAPGDRRYRRRGREARPGGLRDL